MNKNDKELQCTDCIYYNKVLSFGRMIDVCKRKRYEGDNDDIYPIINLTFCHRGITEERAKERSKWGHY